MRLLDYEQKVQGKEGKIKGCRISIIIIIIIIILVLFRLLLTHVEIFA